MKYLFFSLCIIFVLQGFAQTEPQRTNIENMNELPFAQIPPYPEEYTATTTVARMIDGLGYRYYWATESLTKENLEYRPDETARTTLETLDHIESLSETILNVVTGKVNERPMVETDDSYDVLRTKTLKNLEEASNLLKSAEFTDLTDRNITFKRGEKTSSFPFWHLINGQIADALWHVGQVVSFRRASGNPINMGVNVFSGKNRDFKK